MSFIDLFTDYSFWTILFLVLFAFIAGFIDAIVGGGGLIQLPALLISFPQEVIATLFGTNKIAAFTGTSFSAAHYSRRIKFNFKLLLFLSLFAAISSFSGAKIVSFINVQTLKPLILIILIIIAIYTFLKKDLGKIQTKSLSFNKRLLFGSIMAIIFGFYDGFFGPGTGSFFVLGFVVFLGFEFIEASAYAKVINSFTNLAAIYVFISQGNFLLGIAIIMAISNISGNIIGTKMALKKGNGFVRTIFLIVVCLMIIRYAYDIFYRY